MLCSTILNIFLIHLHLLQKLRITNSESYPEVSIAIMRHGDRTPIDAVPEDPFPPEKWKEGPGHLTNTGIARAFATGYILSRHYNEEFAVLNGTHYDPDQIYIRSSDIDRCIRTVQTVASSMFHPSGWQVWNKSFFWLPVPIHVVPVEQDDLLRSWKINCTNLLVWYSKLEAEIVIKVTEDSELRNVWNYLKLKIGPEISPMNVLYIYDSLLIKRENNKSMPEWVTEQIYDEMSKLSKFLYEQEFGFKNSDYIKLLAGIF